MLPALDFGLWFGRRSCCRRRHFNFASFLGCCGKNRLLDLFPLASCARAGGWPASGGRSTCAGVVAAACPRLLAPLRPPFRGTASRIPFYGIPSLVLTLTLDEMSNVLDFFPFRGDFFSWFRLLWPFAVLGSSVFVFVVFILGMHSAFWILTGRVDVRNWRVLPLPATDCRGQVWLAVCLHRV